MIIDTSLLWRKMLAIAPRWVRFALVGSIVMGECVRVLAKVLAPMIDAHTRTIVDFSAVTVYEWPLLGILVTMPVAFSWHVLGKHFRGETPFERAEEYISIMKMAAAAASLSSTQAKFFWHSALGKLAAEFSVGSAPPDPKSLGAEIVEKDTP